MDVDGRQLGSVRSAAPVAIVVTIAAWLLVCGTVALFAQESAQFVVVLHPSVEVESLTAKQISDLFLKKATVWPDGSEVVAVDLPSDSPVRASFSGAIHERRVSAVKSYWQRQIFSGGAVPPPEKATEAEVVAFVRGRRGAIGYVSPSAAVDGLRLVRIRE
jgi:ABC-type phosphate transport system substrate-binding protein